MRLFRGIRQLVTVDPSRSDDVAPGARALGVIPAAALLVDDAGVVTWLGPERAAPAIAGMRVVDLAGSIVTPGFVDCHTHIVYGGDRAADFAQRAAGASYEQIAARGGGIQTTVRATRAARDEDLLASAERRLRRLLSMGVTTAEVKSGYGLDPHHELRLLRVIRELGRVQPVRVVPTFLGAHVVPTAFGTTREAYVAALLDDMLPAVARDGLAEFCDVFCEVGAFDLASSARILEAARALGLGLKVHAEQLSHLGAARLAARLGATSADHLEFADASDAEALAAAGTVAVLLPGASLFLGAKRWAPARLLLDAGVAVALSTDCNPGSANTTHLPLMATLGCTCLAMAPHEALWGITRAAARAVRRESTAGQLAPGRAADFVVLDLPDIVHLPYEFGANPVRATYIQGQCVYSAAPEFRPGASIGD